MGSRWQRKLLLGGAARACAATGRAERLSSPDPKLGGESKLGIIRAYTWKHLHVKFRASEFKLESIEAKTCEHMNLDLGASEPKLGNI